MEKNKNNSWQLVVLGLIVLFSFGLKMYYDYYWPKAQVTINNRALNVLVSDNIKHWVKGLGGRKDLGEYDGMIFLFPSAVQHVFVMRDMQFPIDIIWIKDNKIVDMAPNVPLDPVTTEAELTPYAARDISNSVLELKAGSMDNLHLKIGDNVQISR
ncbi:MAG: DUF192 domain-containing protein [Candidatus Magasanikbacteria bacterium]|nr:DUF192 domain-containing protein [Candidatus Magasanikbacteria bacterium]